MNKKIYFKPLCKVVKIEIEKPLMSGSEEKGNITVGDNTVKDDLGDKLPWDE